MYVDTARILRKFRPLAIQQFQLSSNEFRKSVRDINLCFPTVYKNIRRFMHGKKILEKEIQRTIFELVSGIKGTRTMDM